MNLSFFRLLRRPGIIQIALVLMLCLSPASPLPASPSAAGTPVFASETEPNFVFKISFRLARPDGSTQLILNAGKNESYQVTITSTAVALSQTSAGKTMPLVKASASFSASNDILVTRRGALLRVALNGRVLLETKKAVQTVKSIRLFDPNARLEMLEAPRLQPTEEIYLADDFMTTPEAPSHWRGVSGTWHVAGAGRPRDAADPFKFTGFVSGEGAREAIALNADSRWFWSDYQAEVSSRAVDDKAGFGLVIDYRGPQDFLCFSWDGANAPNAGAGKMRLWRREGNQTIVLAQRAASTQAGQWYRIAVSTSGTQVAVYVDENPALHASDPHLSGGQIGLYAAGQNGAEFDDVQVQSVASTALSATRGGDADAAWKERTFATDPFMAAWGNAGADWEDDKADDGAWYWNRNYFFKAFDMNVSAALLAPENSARLLEISFFGEDSDRAKGCRLAIGSGKISLLKNSSVLASGVLAPQGDVTVSVRGANILVSNGAGKVLSYTDRALSGQGHIRLRFATPVAASDIAGGVEITSPNLKEYRFDAAPTDWKIESGLWQSTTRWACVPNWNFYGGKSVSGESTSVATVWNKRGFGGDGWIEAFVAPSEGTSDQMHFAFPINLNIAFGASGERLGSGYNLVYRVHDEATILYRGAVPVAQSTAMVLPHWRDDPMNVYYRMTETWQHLEILREGGRIRIWAEIPGPAGKNAPRRQLIDYTDPAPLRGDRIALWTWGINGMSLAKLRVSSQQTHAPYADFAKPVAAATPEKDALQRRVNEVNGGAFRIDLMHASTPMNAMPLLKFDYRSTPDTALALYAMANGQLFRADFLGQISGDGDAIPMGSVHRSGANGQLQHASFPLRQVLREFFPSGELPRIEQLFLADLSTRPEQIGGLAVNPKGAVFQWRLAPETSSPVEVPPTTLKLVAPTGADLPDGDIRIAMNGDDDPAEYSVAVNQRPLKWGEAGLEWESETREIRVNIEQAGFRFQDGEKIQLVITPEKSDGFPTFAHQWTMRFALDKMPPSVPQILLNSEANHIENFETGIGNWKTMGGEQGAALWRDTSTAATGKASLRLYHRKLAGPFGAIATDKPFDARRFPILTFSYRITSDVQLSLLCEIGGRWFEIGFTDNDHTFPVIGSISGVQKDNQWHEAEVDLMAAVQRAGLGSTQITKLFFADTGITNNVQDVFWNLDDFRLVPALPAGASTLMWSARDLSGIEGYSWVMDNAPTTVPLENIDHRGSAPVAAGATYLHVRAVDSAGNWSQTAHFRFAPPTAEIPTETPPAVTIETTPENAMPAAPFVSYIPANRLSRLDFEKGLPDDFGIRRSVWVLPDTSTAATGMGSARVVNLQANDFFSAFLQKNPYSIDRYPNVQFDYRFETPDASMLTRRRWRNDGASQRSPYNLNLVAIVNGEMQIVKFIGGPNAYPTFTENTIGEISDARDDGQWHSASVDMGAMLRKRYPKAPRFDADYLATWSTGPHGYQNPQGASLWLDNITLFSTVATSAAFEWQPPKGTAGYSYLLDQKPDTLPDEKIASRSTRCEFKDLKPGIYYFHLRAVDGAGHWSQPSHVRFELTKN